LGHTGRIGLIGPFVPLASLGGRFFKFGKCGEWRKVDCRFAGQGTNLPECSFERSFAV
jgi:hypothetical protein